MKRNERQAQKEKIKRLEKIIKEQALVIEYYRKLAKLTKRPAPF